MVVFLRFLLLAMVSTGVASAATVTWTGPATGSWGTPTNWTPTGVPGTTDNVSIPPGVTTTVDLALGIHALTAAGGVTITGQGTLAVATTVTMTGQLKLSGGTLAGGTLVTGAGGTYVGTTSGTLNGVSIATGTTFDLTQVANATCTIAGGLTLNGTITVGSADGARAGFLLSNETQTWSGTGDVLFGGNNNVNAIQIAGSTLTTAVLIHGTLGRISGDLQSATLINHGTIAGDGLNHVIFIDFDIPTFINAGGGLVEAINSGNVFISATNWTCTAPGDNAPTGSLLCHDGFLDLAGTFSTSTANTVTRISTQLTGADVDLEGTILNTGGTFAPVGGTWLMDGGTVDGGTIGGTGAAFRISSNPNNTLNNVTIAAGASIDLGDIPDSVLNITGGMVLDGTITAGSASAATSIVANTTQTWTGTGDILFGSDAGNRIILDGSGTTLDTAVRIHGANALVRSDVGGNAIINRGLIAADVGGGTITIDSSIPTLTSTGAGAVLEATNGGTLVINAANWTAVSGSSLLAASGTLALGGTFPTATAQRATRTGAGAILLTGTLTNTSATFNPVSTSGGSWLLSGGTVSGGSISGGVALVGTPSNGTLLNVTIATGTAIDLGVTQASTLTITGGMVLNGTILVGGSASASTLIAGATQTWSGSGDIRFGATPTSSILLNAGVALTTGPSLTIHGATGQFISAGAPATVTNHGTIAADVGGGTIRILSITTLANTGSLTATSGGTLDIEAAAWSSTGGGAARADAGTLDLGGTFTTPTAQAVAVTSGGRVNLTGFLSNAGGLLDPASTGGSWFLAGGSIDGGSIGGAVPLIGTTAGGTLHAVRISSGSVIDLGQTDGTTCSITGGLTLDGRILIGSQDGACAADLIADGTQTWTGLDGGIDFCGSPSNRILLRGSGTTLTISPSSGIDGISGRIDSDSPGTTLVNQGTIDAEGVTTRNPTVSPGAVTVTGNIASFINSGALGVANGSTLTIEAASWACTGAGFISVRGATANLGGTFSNDTAQTVIIGPGGIVNLTGTLLNNGLFAPANTGGDWFLQGGTIQGGAIGGAGALIATNAAGSTLSGVSIDAETTIDMTQVDNARLTIDGGMVLDGTLLLGASDGSRSATLRAAASQSWAGTGRVVLGGSAGNSILLDGAQSAVALVVGNQLTIAGSSGAISSSGLPGSIFNSGTIAMDVAGGSFSISLGSFVNLGTLALGQGFAQVLTCSAAFTQASSGTLSIEIGGPGDFDRLAVGGTASLAGTLTIRTIDGFAPGNGQAFAILTSTGARSGAFATVDSNGVFTLDTSGATAVLAVANAVTSPSVLVTTASSLTNASPLAFTVEFSEAVTGLLSSAGLVVTNGTVTGCTGSGTTFTVDVTPTAQGPVTLQIAAGVTTSAAHGLANQASNVASAIFDTAPPHVMLALTGAIPLTTSATVHVAFSEPVTGFTIGSLTAAHATLSSFTIIDAATYSLVVTPTSATSSAVVTVAAGACSDFAGNLNLGASLTAPVESTLVSTLVATPPVPLSSGSRVVYTALGPGTGAGLEQVRAFLAGKATSQARGFIWDASAQSYVQVPAGGWLPTQGVFLATRVATAFDFNGRATTLDFTLTLRPGYNFICVPPLDDGGTVLVDHAFADLVLEDTDGAPIIATARDALIGTGVFGWDGSAYRQVGTLHTGSGYWIENASSPPVDLVLRRVSQQSLGSAVATLPGARAIGARPRSSPPPPPGVTASGSSAGDGGGKACGLGSGVASLVLALTALFLRLRLRSPRRS